MIAGVALLLALAACTLSAMGLRFAQWHDAESEFWLRIAVLVADDPAEDAHYRPLLIWAKTNRPAVMEMVRGWQPPAERRRRAS